MFCKQTADKRQKPHFLQYYISDFDETFWGCPFDPDNQNTGVKTKGAQNLFTKSAVCLQNTYYPVAS